MKKMEEKNIKIKQIKLQNNVIDCYKNLKNDKEKSLFLLKIFKFLVENEEIMTKNSLIEGMFLGIKPSLKITEVNSNWGGKRYNAGNKINKDINQDENQLDNQDDNQVQNQVPYKYKDISIKNKDNNNMQDENKNNFERYSKPILNTDDFREWTFWMDRTENCEFRKWVKDNNIPVELIRQKIEEVIEYYNRPENNTHDFIGSFKKFILKAINGGSQC